MAVLLHRLLRQIRPIEQIELPHQKRVDPADQPSFAGLGTRDHQRVLADMRTLTHEDVDAGKSARRRPPQRSSGPGKLGLESAEVVIKSQRMSDLVHRHLKQIPAIDGIAHRLGEDSSRIEPSVIRVDAVRRVVEEFGIVSRRRIGKETGNVLWKFGDQAAGLATQGALDVAARPRSIHRWLVDADIADAAKAIARPHVREVRNLPERASRNGGTVERIAPCAFRSRQDGQFSGGVQFMLQRAAGQGLWIDGGPIFLRILRRGTAVRGRDLRRLTVARGREHDRGRRDVRWEQSARLGSHGE